MVTGDCEPVGGVVALSAATLFVQVAPSLGVAVGEFTAAPTEPGVYDGTAAGLQSPSLPFQFEITGVTDTTEVPTAPTTPTTAAPGGMLPESGANGIGTTTGIALGLFVAGLGMFVVAQVRRRQAPITP